ncbi:hypothetical protein C4D60_Mb10t26310 [Musa balbisiana]|uniref:GAE domain-containing protein n=1 Tax=Musa balbisiana TaxID=52838 RepID=A0A4S8J001_MUSBA|nr:hypothetical protein C4D60_Mb10t26310 [Musa balbisiana]
MIPPGTGGTYRSDGILAGNYVKDDVWHALIVAISNAPYLQGYCVRSLYKAFQTYSDQESLVRVAVWCIGEYGEMLVNNVKVLEMEEPMTVTESDAVDVLEASLKNCSSDITTQSLSLIALLKLSSRFPPTSEQVPKLDRVNCLMDLNYSSIKYKLCQRIREIIMYHKGSVVLELQQRAIEFNSIIQRHQNIKSSLLEQMPVLDEMTYLLKKSSSSQANVSADKTSKSNSRVSLKLPNGVIHAPATPDLDLLDLSSDDNPANTSSSNDYLHDLLGIGLTNTESTGNDCLEQEKCSQVKAGFIVDQGIAPSEGTDILMDLLSIGAPTVQNDILVSDAVSSNQGIVPATKPSSTTQVMDLLDGTPTNTSISDYQNPVHPSIIAFQSNTLMITFTFTKQADDPKVTQIQATFTNLSSDTYTDFVFQAAVPKSATKAITEIRPLANAGVVPLLAAHLLNHHYHHSSKVEAQENATTSHLNLSISTHEVLMCTSGILDALIGTHCLLSPTVAQYVVTTLYSLLSIEA